MKQNFNPPADADALRDSAKLTSLIAARIAEEDGFLGFDEYMRLALYAPGLGYYACGRAFAGAGDFVTAPRLGDAFARCLAVQCAEVLAELGGGAVLEFGAGDGRLASGLLRAMQPPPDEYWIVEVSDALRAMQKQKLAECGDAGARVRWLTRLPENFRGVIIANEVLDAMPAKRFVMRGGVACELGIAIANGGFEWAVGAALGEDVQMRLQPFALPDGHKSELGLQAESWLRSVGARLHAGVLLLTDYGFPRREFYHRQRNEGTLMCHYRHRAHSDAFWFPGLQDISVHLDFTALAEAAAEVGLHLAGYTSQGAFLLALGVLDGVAEDADARDAMSLSREVRKLTMPGEMGELFKAIAFARGCETDFRGFGLRDRRGALTP